MCARLVFSCLLLLLAGCSTTPIEPMDFVSVAADAGTMPSEEPPKSRSTVAAEEIEKQPSTGNAFQALNLHEIPSELTTLKGPALSNPTTPRNASVAISKGNLAYFVPNKMTVGKLASVDLWIDRQLSLDALQLAMAKQLNLDRSRIRLRVAGASAAGAPAVVAGAIEGRTGWVGDHMVAELSGSADDFSIEPKGPVPKSLIGDGRATWNWRVVPKRASRAEGMFLHIDVRIDQGIDKESLPTIHESVVVAALPAMQQLPGILAVISTQLTWFNGVLGLFGIAGIGGLASRLRTWLRRRSVRETPLPSI